MELAEYHALAKVEAAHWWYAGMRAIAGAWLRPLAWPAAGQVLDAGCGVGGGLRWLREFGAPTGIDWHPLAAAYAHHHAPQTGVARASVAALPFPAAAFHLVTCFDVLYHQAVADEAGAVRELARVLRPGGWLMIRVPAHDWLRGAHDRQVHTRRRFSRAGLRALLLGAGLEIARLSPVGASLLPPALIRRLGQPAAAAASDVALPPPLLNRVLTSLLAAERHWLARADLPFGLSLLALARRP